MPIKGIRCKCGLMRGDFLPVGTAAEPSAAVRPWTLIAAPPAPSTAWATSIGVDRVRQAPVRIFAVADGRTGLGHAANNLADAIGISQQVGAAFGLLGNVADGTAEIDVHDADAVLVGQPLPDGGQRLGIVVQICTASGRDSSATPQSRSGKPPRRVSIFVLSARRWV